ncbi:MAG: prolipoprotein diacylglyceryl transferase [Candidatus Omnitrophica bacterium]|nr:prolipoprotein diacylglyceryl transferase [Candidatus Omnitrophota bacterium]MBD3268555.1 prolipoprotein diacylglyceryl transferase [Candidatus Omnitrophota bacterium]
MYPELFSIGPLTFYTYGFLVLLGIILSFLVCRAAAGREGIERPVFENLFFWSLLWGFIGARILYVVTEWESFLKTPWEIIFNRSGFVFYGGFFFGGLALYFISTKKKINFFKIADIFILGVPLAHSFGRIGCFCYGCCYGVPTSSGIGVLFPPDSPAGMLGAKVIPTQLISALSLFMIFILLLLLRKKKRFNGQLLVAYLFLYSTFRFIIEFFRGDPRGTVFNIPTSQFISLFMFIAAVVLLFALPRKKNSGR